MATPPYATEEDMRVFYQTFHQALMAAGGTGEVPSIEAPRRVIERILSGRMQGFDEVQYIIFQGVKVFEEGRRPEAERRDALTSEQKVHQGMK